MSERLLDPSQVQESIVETQEVTNEVLSELAFELGMEVSGLTYMIGEYVSEEDSQLILDYFMQFDTNERISQEQISMLETYLVKLREFGGSFEMDDDTNTQQSVDGTATKLEEFIHVIKSKQSGIN